MNNLTIGSLFDGSGTAPLAATMLGMSPVWASEIEPFPIAVTKARFPEMKHLGDISKINGAEIDPVNIIVGGSPCTDLSVAGKQLGLQDGKQSHLFYEMTRIVREMRDATHGTHPRFVIWENVPGAFSSNKGEDFRAVVEEFCRIADDAIHIARPTKWRNAGAVVGDEWSFAWRVIDAKHWGVPQRRRRIYAILDLGSERAGEILFEHTGLPWNTEPCGEKGQGASSDAVGCADRSGGVRCLNPWMPQSARIYDVDGVYPALSANATGGLNRQAVIGQVGSFCAGAAPAAGSIGYSESVAPTLKAGQCAFPMGAVVYEPMSVKDENWAEADAKNALRAGASKSSHAVVYPVGDVRSLCARADSSPCIDRGQPFVAYESGQGYWMPGFGCLRAEGENRPSRPSHVTVYENHQHSGYRIGCGTLRANGGDYGGGSENLVVEQTRRYIVRRLTPTECARLQGFSDWWTEGIAVLDPTEKDIEFWTGVWEMYRKVTNPKGKPKTRKQILKWLRDPGSDSNKYKMWGNGMALPCVLAILNGIVDSKDSTIT